MLLGVLSAFGTTSDIDIHKIQLSETVERLALFQAAQHSERDVIAAFPREARIRPGDNITRLFLRMDIDDGEALRFLQATPHAAVLFRQMAPGKVLSAEVGGHGELLSLSFPLNGGNSVLKVIRNPDGFDISTEAIEYEKSLSIQSAVVRHSLFGAADDAGIPDSIATKLADIFGGDIDFHRDLRRGDRFSVVYEAVTHNGKLVRADHILAAEFINDGKSHRAFWYQDMQGTGGYYMEDGRSIRKAFLKSPLEFSRITSGFSNARYHPILKETRAHRGIDYGAPTGTRVKATGDGVIDFAGIQGGYGKLVTIRHPGDKVTLYGHLSGFASGIKKGGRVMQGDLIGYVGATGLASGPHLHYEFRVSGIHRNPLAMTLPAAAPLPAAGLALFKSNISGVISQLETARGIQLVMLD
jgi:murein DD-endopeptidase MepM/ murein hydrolase activator NlpD